jgi:hypothetical protein
MEVTVSKRSSVRVFWSRVTCQFEQGERDVTFALAQDGMQIQGVFSTMP